jgi:hypothetical protein
MQAAHRTRWSACTLRLFPTHTRFETSPSVLSALRVGDVVLGHEKTADKGRSAFVPRRVKWAYRNTSTDWILLRWFDGNSGEVITTPSPHFLGELGGLSTTPGMTRTSNAAVVLGPGALAQDKAEIIT